MSPSVFADLCRISPVAGAGDEDAIPHLNILSGRQQMPTKEKPDATRDPAVVSFSLAGVVQFFRNVLGQCRKMHFRVDRYH